MEFIFKISLGEAPQTPFGSFAPSALAIPGYTLKVRPPLSNNLGSAPGRGYYNFPLEYVIS
jgi:hypothetical protein